ncbi:MAG: exported protein of unknown function [Nitrospira sp.]
MRLRSALVIVLLIGAGGITSDPSHPALAHSSFERVALQLNGPSCHGQHANLHSALSAVPGVRSVDLSSVPDHALVDIDTRVLSLHHLLTIVAQALIRSECQAEPMQSCISAASQAETTRLHVSTGKPSRSP